MSRVFSNYEKLQTLYNLSWAVRPKILSTTNSIIDNDPITDWKSQDITHYPTNKQEVCADFYIVKYFHILSGLLAVFKDWFYMLWLLQQLEIRKLGGTAFE